MCLSIWNGAATCRITGKGLVLHLSLHLPLGVLIALSTGALLFLSLGNALEITRGSLAAKLETLIWDAAQQSQAYFDPVEEQGRWLSHSHSNR